MPNLVQKRHFVDLFTVQAGDVDSYIAVGLATQADHFSSGNRLISSGQIVDATYLQGSTVPLNVTGFGLTMRFGTRNDGMPIGVQLVAKWQAESTLLHLATLLESVSPIRDLRPAI